MPLKLEKPEGTMNPGSPFYIERPSDRIALESIPEDGVTITIKGPRQMGKSSLLLRTREAALEAGKQVVVLDFQLFDKSSLTTPDRFFQQFCDWLTDELGLPSKVTEYWDTPLGNSQRATRYLQRYILKEVAGSLVLAMDEVDVLFDTPFQSDFFGMLRSWHNSRELNPLWKRLDLVLVTSTEPYQLVDNLNQSPFNVGEVIELADFTLEQVAELNRRHGSPLTLLEEKRLIDLLSGHPYLVRRFLYHIASGRLDVPTLFNHAMDDQGPFGEHLRHLLFRLHNKPDLIEGMRQVILNHSCADEKVYFRLRGAGLVKRNGLVVVPRCQLYANYFQARSFDNALTHLQSETLGLEAEEIYSKGNNSAFSTIELTREDSYEETGLTGRELEVLRLVTSGLSNPQIAEKLFLSAHTINSHLTSIYSKLRVASRIEAVRFAIEHKLI